MSEEHIRSLLMIVSFLALTCRSPSACRFAFRTFGNWSSSTRPGALLSEESCQRTRSQTSAAMSGESQRNPFSTLLQFLSGGPKNNASVCSRRIRLLASSESRSVSRSGFPSIIAICQLDSLSDPKPVEMSHPYCRLTVWTAEVALKSPD